MPTLPSFSDTQLQSICDVLGDTSEGLIGSEIGRLLAQCGIDDPSPGATKRYRLFYALSLRQRQDQCANNIINFTQFVMDPVRYIERQAQFTLLRDRLNQVLSFAGFQIGIDGKLRQVTAVKTLDEAEQRAGRLKAELQRRKVHPDVLRFCKAELLQDNYFHAILEATKSVAEKIRQKSGLKSDAAELVDGAFGLKSGPKLAFTTLQTESERSEHTGFMNLMKGLFGTFRNPTAHAPKVIWSMNEQDALDLLTMVSFIHRRLDEAVLTGK